MAKEDLLSQLMIQLTQKESPPPEDDNSLIQKIVAPNDSVQLSDGTPTFTLQTPANFVWGGTGVTAGWKWNQGQYDNSYRAMILADKPVAYYRLDENSGVLAYDSSGNGNTGNIVGGVTLSQTGALSSSDKAMGFNGSSGYISVPSNSAFSSEVGNTGKLSLESWIYPTALPSTRQIVLGKGQTTGASPWEYGLTVNGAQIDFVIWSSAGSDYLTLNCGNLSLNNWYHVVCTFDNSLPEAIVYINGSQSGTLNTVNAANAPSTTSANVLIGAGDGQYFQGTIDEVAIYKYALSAQQVKNHYNARTLTN